MSEESKPKMLPPSLRPKKRYIVFEVLSDGPVTYVDFIRAATETMLAFLGELRTSEAKTWFIQNLFDTEKKRGVVKVDHACIEDVRASLALLSIIGESKAVVRVVGVTGTIKSAQMKYLSQE